MGGKLMNVNFPDSAVTTVWLDPSTNINWKFDGQMWVQDTHSQAASSIPDGGAIGSMLVKETANNGEVKWSNMIDAGGW